MELSYYLRFLSEPSQELSLHCHL